MYLGHYNEPQQLAGIGSSLKKAFKKVTNAVTAPVKAVHALVEKNTPDKLLPIVERAHASIERGIAIGVNPLDAPRLVKEEIKQIEDARKDPKFMALVGAIMTAVAVVYPFLQPIAAAVSALKVAAERAAAKKLMAQTQAEADAAQAEFDKYAAELAALQQESAALQAKAVAPSPASAPMVATPLTVLSQPLAPVTREGPQGIDREIERAASSSLPSWAIPAGVAAAALLLVTLSRGRGH